MKEAFKVARMRPASLKLVDMANEVIEQYEADGIQLTLRQLYYQFVARDWLANTQENYKNLGHVISEGRLGGLIDWSAISDLGRVPSIPSWDGDLPTFIEQMKQMANAYSRDRWEGQRYYIELHVEKQAMSSVLGPIARKWGIPFSMNRGYASQTSFYDASKRFIEAADLGKVCVCLYAGDHDPSGEDMVRDFDERMALFGADVEMHKFALTREQIRQYRCPPNPAKESDARAKAYIAKHGRQSWEIDALDPKVLRNMADREIANLVDAPKLRSVLARENTERNVIAKALSNIKVTP